MMIMMVKKKNTPPLQNKYSTSIAIVIGRFDRCIGKTLTRSETIEC